MTIAKSYTFTNNTVANPAEVNQNFDDVINAVKANHHSDPDGTPLDDGDIASGWGLVPQYGILMYYGSIASIPSGYFFCNGANGTPDLRNRFVLCAGQDSGGTYDVGDTGGEETHVLTESEMPSHAHNIYADTSYYVQGAKDGGSQINPWSQSGNGYTKGGNVTATQTKGSGSAHNNMPPYAALAFIMKA